MARKQAKRCGQTSRYFVSGIPVSGFSEGVAIATGARRKGLCGRFSGRRSRGTKRWQSGHLNPRVRVPESSGAVKFFLQ